MVAAARSADSALAVAPRSREVCARRPDGAPAAVDGDRAPPGHGSLRRKVAVDPGKDVGEIAVVAQAVHGRPDGGVDQPIGRLGHGERNVDRLEEIVADNDLSPCGGVQPAQLRVAPEPAGHEVDALELQFEHGPMPRRVRRRR